MLYQLSYAPRFAASQCSPAPSGMIVAVPMVALFLVLTCAFAGIAVGAAVAGRWVIALPTAAIAAWMATVAWASLRRRRR